MYISRNIIKYITLLSHFLFRTFYVKDVRVFLFFKIVFPFISYSRIWNILYKIWCILKHPIQGQTIIFSCNILLVIKFSYTFFSKVKCVSRTSQYKISEDNFNYIILYQSLQQSIPSSFAYKTVYTSFVRNARSWPSHDESNAFATIHT